MPRFENPAIIRKMLFQKSLLRELRSTSGGVFAVLLTTLVTMILIRALGRAAAGRVDGELVLPLIVFNTINLLNTVLMLTAYISILMVLSRWWRDSEMVIWLTSGKSLADLIKPIWSFLWPLLVIIALLSTVIAPWSKQQILEFEDQIQNRGDAQRVSPGQFRESYSGQRVFFLENPDDENGRIGTVFIRAMQPDGRQTVMVSSTGRFEQDPQGVQWVVLEKGYRTDIAPGTLEARTMGFDVYRMRLDQSAPRIRSEETVRTMSLMDLMKRNEPSADSEIAMRIGLPLLTLSLGIFAIPLSVVNARSGRAFNLIIALLIYLIGTNLFGSVKVAVSQGKIDLALAWWPLPLLLLAIALGMIAFKMNQRHPMDGLRWIMSRLGLGRSQRETLT